MSVSVKNNPPLQAPPHLTPQAPVKPQAPVSPTESVKEASSVQESTSSSSLAAAPSFTAEETASQAERASALGDTQQPTTPSLQRDLQSGGALGAVGSSAQPAASARSRSVSLPTQTSGSAGSLVEQAYQQTLGRSPDAAGQQYWDQQVQAQRDLGKNDTQISEFLTERFRQSPEYQVREAVQQTYRDVLGREGDAEGIRYWTQQGLDVHKNASQGGTAPTQGGTTPPSRTGAANALPPLDMGRAMSDPNALLTVAIGHSEGNRTPSGGFTERARKAQEL